MIICGSQNFVLIVRDVLLCSATFSYSRHTKTLSKFWRRISAKSAENLHIKSTVLIILDPKGKFYPTQSELTATSHAPKPTSKQPHIYSSRNVLYV